jgi:hypothetical protein
MPEDQGAKNAGQAKTGKPDETNWSRAEKEAREDHFFAKINKEQRRGFTEKNG